MTEIRYSLVSDGSSDQALLPILSWLLHAHCPDMAIQVEWADLRRLPTAVKGLRQRIEISLIYYPCDLLFVHRDAERLPRDNRADEIWQAMASVTNSPPVVCVVPVRMQEAWLLFDQAAIRKASGNPHGTIQLELPALKSIEFLPNPKRVLHDLLRTASGYSGRRRKKFPVARCALAVSRFIEGYAPLRALPAFQALEAELKTIIVDQGWGV